ncbi:DUF4402 domain-containing protein [Parasphingorhabdus sp.]|uniref:DUF4402 domain-containing protein n=1 Tax=Parasphingorhabdus sp. TaxID=2709688 RepID=UPI0030026222
MKRVGKSLLLTMAMIVCLAWPTGRSHAQCRLCADTGPSGSISGRDAGTSDIPLRIEITTDLDFSRLAVLGSGGGRVIIDPTSGDRQIRGSIANLGGIALHGEGRLTGEPGRNVRIFLPQRIQLSAPNGAVAELERLETNLPELARLDQTGRLNFAFGGELSVRGDASGQFRGRIAITAEYE